MVVEYEGYEIWTKRRESGFLAAVRRLDQGPMVFDQRVVEWSPIDREYSTVPNFETEELAIEEVKNWIDSGTLS